MTSDQRARQYLLGGLTEEERAEIERDYFGGEHGLDRIGEAEDELVEDYLDDALTREEHEQFEREYLASPAHRMRVETIRRLVQGARPSSRPAQSTRRWVQPRWLGLAAAAVLLVSAGIWIAGRRAEQPAVTATATTSAPRHPPQPRASASEAPAGPQRPASPSIFAVELSPLALRGEGETSRIVIPHGTDLVDLKLEQEPGSPPLHAPAAGIITTVSGDEVWRGPATAEGQVVRLRVPAAKLPPDDYIVRVQSFRYFLRVHAR